MTDERRDLRRALVAETLRTSARALRAFVAARVPAAEVDDVVQVAAVRAVERSGSLKVPERVLPWLYRVHRNVIVDAVRQRGSHERLLDNVSNAQEPTQPVDRDACSCSLAQMQSLRPAYSAVLELVDVQDASLSEAARALGISINNATVRLHRARRALRDTMSAHCGVQNARDCVTCRCVDDGCCTV